jgi:hypothetical protein
MRSRSLCFACFRFASAVNRARCHRGPLDLGMPPAHDASVCPAQANSPERRCGPSCLGTAGIKVPVPCAQTQSHSISFFI